MPIMLQCPKCGVGLSVPGNLAGQAIQCGACSQTVEVPIEVLEPLILDDAEPHPNVEAVRAVRAVRTAVVRATRLQAEHQSPRRTQPRATSTALSRAGRIWLAVVGVASVGGVVLLVFVGLQVALAARAANSAATQKLND